MDVVLALLIVLCVPILITDLVARWIPNVWLVCVGVLTLASLGWRAAHGETDLLWVHGLGAVLGLVSLLPFWWLGVMAAGDVKLFAVIGLIAGYHALLPIWCLASIGAGIHALVIVMLRGPRAQMVFARAAGWSWWQRVQAWRAGRKGLPFGAYLAAAAVWLPIWLPQWGR